LLHVSVKRQGLVNIMDQLTNAMAPCLSAPADGDVQLHGLFPARHLVRR